VFAEACETAVRRLLAAPEPLAEPVLFDDEELASIADALSRTIATADLMGRARIRRRAQMAGKLGTYNVATETFTEASDDPFSDFAEPVPALAPESALAYFRKLVPALGASTVRYGPRLDRHTFTLAVAADQVILDRVKSAILTALQSGTATGATPDVQDILDSAGVSLNNPQYAEMVVRTNLLDAYNQGAEAELAEPEMKEAFPAWEYLGVLDDRTGDDHKPKIGKYYPASASFAEVRGPRVFNCRCSFAPVSRYLMSGVRVEERW
jgi:SPP1 gp7 family putative phage head morphogenesis protein